MAGEEKERSMAEPIHLDDSFVALTFIEESDDVMGTFDQVFSPSSSPYHRLKRLQLKRKMSVGSLREIKVSLSDLQQFHNELEQRC